MTPALSRHGRDSGALAILTAAGSGSRLGAAVPKALVELDGVPLVVRAAYGLVESGVVGAVVVTAPRGDLERFAALFPAGGLPLEAGSELGAVPVQVVSGGATRQESVARGLAAGLEAAPGADVVLVHDAARCMTPPDMVARVVDAVERGHAAVIPALPVTDTIKRVEGADEFGVEPVTETIDRRALRAVQTPQGFTRALIERAHREGAARAADEATAASDDAALVEALGERVWVVPGDERALKITTARDLAVSELLLRTSLVARA